MSRFASRPDISPDQWLAHQYRHMVTDLAATLNLAAGLREATIPLQHTNLVTDLGDVLDIEAGLSDIVPTPPNATPYELKHAASLHAPDADLSAAEDRFETDPEQASPNPASLPELEGLARDRAHDLCRYLHLALPAVRRRTFAVPAIAALIIVGVVPFYGNIAGQSAPADGPISAISAGQNAPLLLIPLDPLIPADDADIKDVTLLEQPAVVRLNERFIKTWEVQNTGSVVWRDRYLTRQTTDSDTSNCSAPTPTRIPIPVTQPGQKVQISVTLTAPTTPGTCDIAWEMTDTNGKKFFPNKRSFVVFFYTVGEGR